MSAPTPGMILARDREGSPASSVGTTYPADQTSFEDLDENCGQEEFEARCRQNLKLDVEPVVDDSTFPLLPPIPTGGPERNLALQKNLEQLRKAVKELEENVIFEEAKLRGSRVALPEEPPKHDIDSILFGMIDMAPPSASVSPFTSPRSFGASTAMASVDTGGTATGRKGGVFKGKARQL